MQYHKKKKKKKAKLWELLQDERKKTFGIYPVFASFKKKKVKTKKKL